jgi:hypothetical protein
MYQSAQAYRQDLHCEVINAMEIVPHDAAFKTQLYKSICSIEHNLPLDIAERIRSEVFEIVNQKLKQIGSVNRL